MKDIVTYTLVANPNNETITISCDDPGSNHTIVIRDKQVGINLMRDIIIAIENQTRLDSLNN
jgi:hypothetical protein